MVDKRLFLALLLAGCPVTESAFDQDGDGFVAVEAGGDDCDDRNANIYPGAPEICGNGVDDNCDSLVDRVFQADGSGAPAALMFGEIRVAQGTLYFLDEDRDGYGRDEVYVEECPVGGVIAGQTHYVEAPGDCDDTDPTVNPGVLDNQCDGVDSNCDGTPDSDVDPEAVWWPDRDGDRWGDDSNPARARLGCPPTDDPNIPRWSDQPGDCDDLNANVNPGVTERCDGVDNNCSGRADDAVLGDGPQCPGQSCADIHEVRPETANGEFWVGPRGSAVLAQCEVSSTHGRGWMLVTLPWAREQDRGTFLHFPDASGSDRRWIDVEGTSAARLRPGQRSGGREVRLEIRTPMYFTEIRGSWSMRGFLRDSNRLHEGRDLFDPVPRWGFPTAMSSGQVLFGVVTSRDEWVLQETNIKTEGWGWNWVCGEVGPGGCTEDKMTPVTFRMSSPIEVHETTSIIRWAIQGGQSQEEGADLNDVEIFVR